MQIGRCLLTESELCIGFFYTCAQLFYRANTDFLLPVFRTPDGQRNTPVTGAGEVPVLQIFQPLTETTTSGALRLPVDGPVQFGHSLFGGRGPDKPRIERVIEYRFVGTPAVRVVVCVFFDFECLVVLFQAQGNQQIGRLELFIGGNFFRIVFCFYIAAAELFAQFRNKAPLTIHQRERQFRAFLIRNSNHRYSGIARHAHVVRAKVRSRMYYTCTVFGGHKIAGNNAEGARFQFGARHVRKQLFITDTAELAALHGFDHPVRNSGFFLRCIEGLHGQVGVFRIEIGRQAVFSQYNRHRQGVVRTECLHLYILNIGADSEGHVTGQRPGRGRPGQNTYIFAFFIEQESRLVLMAHPEHGNHGKISHLLVAARQIEFVRTQACSGGRTKRLYSKPFIEIGISLRSFLLVQPPQQRPYRLDVFVFKRDIGFFQVHPVPHFPGDIIPHILVAHDRTAARPVIIIHRDLFTDILLGNTEFLFHLQFDRQAMRIPAAFAVNPVALERIIAAEKVLDRSRHHVVNPRLAIGGRRTFVKDVGLACGTLLHRLFKNPFLLPEFKDFGVNSRKIELFEFAIHKLWYYATTPPGAPDRVVVLFANSLPPSGAHALPDNNAVGYNVEKHGSKVKQTIHF